MLIMLLTDSGLAVVDMMLIGAPFSSAIMDCVCKLSWIKLWSSSHPNGLVELSDDHYSLIFSPK